VSFNQSNSQYSARKKGTVTLFGTRGPHGFIDADDGATYYCHQGECSRVPGQWLKPGDRVSFETKGGKFGDAAAFVRLLVT
jgi:cold shock CspA family protein